MKTLTLIVLLIGLGAQAQRPTSIATDLSLLRSYSRGHKFLVPGQSVRVTSHVTPRTGVYAAFSYHTEGSFEELLPAQPTALPFGTPPSFVNRGKLRYQQLSLGVVQYLRGNALAESDWNLYATAGLGLLSARITNQFDDIDTAQYQYPIFLQEGKGRFRRLTLDVGVGGELPIGGSIYLYSELRTWLQTSDSPSPYLYNNDVPRAVLLNLGLRILFY